MGISADKTEVGGRGRKCSDRNNYETIRSNKWMIILWHSFRLTWNSVDLRSKYNRRTQDGKKRPIIYPRTNPCPPLPTHRYNFLGSFQWITQGVIVGCDAIQKFYSIEMYMWFPYQNSIARGVVVEDDSLQQKSVNISSYRKLVAN